MAHPYHVPTGFWDDWCEAGTRRGHYNWRWFGVRPAQGTATTTDATIRMMYGTACFTQEFFEMLIQSFMPFP